MSELSKRRLKMWIRLLGITRATESNLREHLRINHSTTLPRFDVMAALWRRREGVMMSELSRMLLVSNGNATTIVDRLESDGFVRRTPSKADRRSIMVSLTTAGLKEFELLAASHESALSKLFSNVSETDLDAMTEILKRMEI